MTTLQWLLRLLYACVIIHSVVSIYFHEDDLLTRRFVDHDFFAHNLETTGTRRADIFTATGDYSVGADWCGYAATGDSGTVTATVTETGGCTVASLKHVINTIMGKPQGSAEDDLNAASNTYFKGDLFEVSEITAEASTQTLKFKTKPRSQFRLFAYLQVQVATEVEFAFKKSAPISMTNLQVKLTGESMLGVYKAETEIVKEIDNDLFEIKKLDVGGGVIQVFADIAKKFTIYPPGMARESDNFNYGKIAPITFDGVKGYGGFKINDEFQIILESKKKESHTQLAGFAGIKSYFIMTRGVDGNGQVTPPFGSFFWKMPPNKNILEVVKPILTSPNVRALPLLRRFADRKWCMSVSSKAGNLLPLKSISDALSVCFPTGTPQNIPVGFNLKIQIKLKETLEDPECGATPEQVAALPEIAVVQGAITIQAVKFSFPGDYNTPLRATINCMGAGDFGDVPFNLFNEEGVDKEPIIQIQELSFNPAQDTMTKPGGETLATNFYFRITFVLTLPTRYSTIAGTSIGIGPLKLHIQTNPKGGWDIIGVATIKLNGIDVLLQLGKTTGKGWKFVFHIPSLTLSDIIRAFKNTPEAKEEKVIPDLLEFGVKDFQLEWLLDGSGKTQLVRIRGNPIVFGYDGANLEGIWWKPKNTGPIQVNNKYTGERIIANQPENARAIAVWFKKVNFDWFIKKLIGEDTMSVSFFSNMNAIFVSSNAAGAVKESAQGDSKPFTKDSRRHVIKSENPSTNKHTTLRRRIHKRRNRRDLQTQVQRTASTRTGGQTDIKDEDAIEFYVPGLQGTVIRPGISIMLQWKMPAITTACFSNEICVWMVENLGTGAHFQLTGYFKQAGSFEVTARLGGMNKWIVDQVLKFDNIMLKLKVGMYDPSLRLGLTVIYYNEDLSSTGPLKFFGAIEIGFTGRLIVEAGMGGTIDHPWKSKGNKYFSFGNLYISAGVSIGPMPFPAIQAGGKILLGVNPDCSDPKTICVECYFGFDPNRPLDFWVYAKVNPLTVKKICEAFDFSCTIPKPIENLGFPDGFTFSYANPAGAGKSIPALGLNVPAGLFISGKFTLFDDGDDNKLELWGKLIVQKGAMEIDIQMSPINWIGGLIKVQRNEQDSENGPIFFMRAAKPNYFRVNIQGYAEVIGIRSLVEIQLEESGFKFHIEGSWIPGLLEVGMELNATYSGFKQLEFSFMARLQTSQFATKLAEAIRDFVNKYSEAAKAKIDEAKLKVDAAKQRVLTQKEPVERWQNEIREWKAELQRKYDALEAKKAAMQTDCKARCEKVCIGFLEWNSRCWKVFGYWVGCPRWNSCYSRIDDIICLAKCEINKIAAKFSIWVEQVGIKIQRAMGSIAIGLGHMANGVLDMAAGVVNFGNSILDFANTAFQAIGKAAKWLAENINKFFNLRNLQFFARLTKTFDACVGYDIDATIFGMEFKKAGTACINLEIVYNMIKSFLTSPKVEAEYPGLADTKANLEKTDSKIDALADAESKFDKAKKAGENELTSEMAKKYDEEVRRRRSGIPHSPDTEEWLKSLPKRFTVPTAPTAEDMKYINAETMPIPEYNVRNEYITNAFMKSSPWKLYETFDVVGLNEKPKRDDTQSGQIRSLDFDSQMSSCERVKRALIGYKDITDGLITSAKSLADQDESFMGYKRSLYNQKDDVYKQIRDIETHHNMTDDDREDAYYWYNVMDDGLRDMSKRSEIVLTRQSNFAIPIIRRQLDFVLKKEKGSTFNEFADIIHANAMKGYKRSQIPTPETVDGEKTLSAIKKELVSIISNDEGSLTEMSERLHDVRSNIHTMSTYTKSCRSQ